MGFPGGSDSKECVRNVGDLGSIPGLGRSPGAGNGNPLQYSCLENPTDRGAWWATVHGVAKSRTRLSPHAQKLKYCKLGWGIPGNHKIKSICLPQRSKKFWFLGFLSS